eukprot:5058680-Pyramimonas_sp.AAC.1
MRKGRVGARMGEGEGADTERSRARMGYQGEEDVKRAWSTRRTLRRRGYQGEDDVKRTWIPGRGGR